MFRIKTAGDVAAWRLCMGCGICYSMCPEHAITLEHVEDVGIRPRIDSSRCRSCGECIISCPGIRVNAENMKKTKHDGELLYGAAIGLYVGHAHDAEVRYTGSSGGVLSALAQYCLDHEDADSILHTGMDESRPWMNKSYSSATKQDVLSRAGSRYAPSSPGELLRTMGDGSRNIFIGKPCDAAGVMSVCERDTVINSRVALVMSFFCAGVPSTRGTLDLIGQLNSEPKEIARLRYRGNGWPGEFTIETARGSQSIPYRKSWGFLTKYVQWRCRICPHGVGQVSDISCGDAWHLFDDNSSDMGKSIIIVRTERGGDIVHNAAKRGYVDIEPVDSESVLRAQVNLLNRHREVFGRLLAMRLTGMPVPGYRGFPMFNNWMRLSLMNKVKSFGGTLRRIITRKLWKRDRLLSS